MNEHIKEIWLQAVGYVNPIKTGGDWQRDFDDKFAELLVKKFDDILLLEHLDCVGNKDKQSMERIQRLREKVKTYFGVEE